MSPPPKNAIPRRTFRASTRDDARPLGDFVSRQCPEVPIGFLNKLIRKGFVLVDGELAHRRDRLRPGQHVVVSLPKGAFLVAPNPAVPFDVVYEDSHLVVVEKPAGVVSEPGIGHKLDTLLNGLIARYGEQLDRLGPEHDYGMVHRLDRDTSGLLVVARRADVHHALRAQFRRRTVKKRYLALVAGSLSAQSGEIALPVGRVRRGGRARGLTGEPGRPALTGYRVIERFPAATLVEATPETGRWRQIRLHFKAIGHVIAGDSQEGDADMNTTFARDFTLARMFLHAAFLRFKHPENERPLEFASALPQELQRVLQALRNRPLT